MTTSKQICKDTYFVGDNELFILHMKLIMAVGLNEAVVLQRLHYWLENPNVGIFLNGHKWIYNTYPQWQKGDGINQKGNFPFWSIDKIKKLFISLEHKGLVISCKPERAKWNHQKYYRIDYEVLQNYSVELD